uniref:Methionine synthase reductase n=1 Tax=Globisporangium ultimum (strain ATCC 200006 / CBS 805.95 / DAOM BR144) TaxID=431595 RepID=K3X218_GLOUD
MPPAVTIFYGSQTGCAESIAQRFYDEALEREYEAEFLPLNEFQNSKVTEMAGHHVIVVCSTTGNGEPPDNAGKFWRFVKRRTQPKDMLQNLRFTVLGLGDTNYDKFCYMGKSIDKRFTELGAQRFYDMCAADEALGLEDSVEPWADSLWAAFDKSCGVGDVSTDTSSDEDAALDGANGNSPQTADQDEPLVTLPYVPVNLVSYETMFGPLDGPTPVPEDVPKLPSSLFSVRFLDDGAAEAATVAALTPSPPENAKYSSTQPFVAKVAAARYLTASHSERKVLGLDIDITGSGLKYTPGDSIGIKCPNREEDVNALLTRLELNGSKLFCLEAAAPTGRVVRRPTAAKSGAADRFPSPCSVRDAFVHHVDILSSPKKAALRALATYCSDEEERARLLVLSSKSGADKYKAFIGDQHLNFVELLYLFPSCTPPLDHFLSLLPQMMPRYYSIASSPLANPDQLLVALTVVDESVGASGIRRLGLCTNWLDSISQPLLAKQVMSPEVKVPIFLRPTRDFQLPASHQWPLLLIGPGTGVAPFMGFLQHRYYEVKNHLDQASDVCTGEWRGGIDLDLQEDEEYTKSPAIAESKGIYLFFGNRHKSEDWIFQQEMEEFVANGTIRQLFTAFSRDEEEKHYVQHELRANGKLVADLLLESGGYVYVCGDGLQMARDVHEALRDILQEHGNLSKEGAEEQLGALASRQRYVRDIWG